MQSFLQRRGVEVKGSLSGLDRIRFRGTIRWLASLRGMGSFLATCGVLLKNFKPWAQALTKQILLATEHLTESTGRPLVYLPSSQERKEDRARSLATQDGITEGLIGVFKCVEPCRTFEVGPNRALKELELRLVSAKCAHLYFYLQHRQFGLMHVRLQTWLPFTAQVCLNGRDWLARQLRQAGIGFEQRDNCFVDVADLAQAQAFLDKQLQVNWSGVLNGLLDEVHPARRSLFGDRQMHHYWSADETEWATDLLFRSATDLKRLYPRLVKHAIQTFGSGDVLRFLGHRPQAWRFHGSDIVTTLKTRPEGMRVKHQLNRNSVKMYDKQQSVLRVETTINDPCDFKVYRPKEGDPEGPKSWRRLRKGVADLHRRAEVSQKSNERYLESLAAVDQQQTLGETARPICQPTTWAGRKVRGLQPFQAADAALLAAVSRGEFAIQGFRNRDLRPLLFGAAEVGEEECRRQAAKVTRLLRLLRAHGLVAKVAKTHRYQLTDRGRTTITALQIAQQTPTDQLAKLAG